MRDSARYLLVCSALLLTGMRDPFHPPDDPCAVGELAQWHYRGMVGGIGILQDGLTRWHRVKTQARLPASWQIISMNEAELVVSVGEKCDPTQWTWQREGTNKNEFKDNASAVGAQQPAERRTKASHAGGG
ncbi:HofP DNA utilization family protein [Enterobacter sp. UNJFSC 003]|uniref:HofP DNA utilization family protein n=1 Tax=Enterobacter sp. UNJFSC 003 TaxID=3122077 RepID=UPI002EA39BD8|nr:HofP DNA utilization family protein [Serratia liquefaciens]